ncbi:putative ferric-chelate reductase [Aspergillus floccosus]
MMHMSEHTTGLPWLDQPVTLHSSRADTCKLTPEQCAYRRGHWRYWYEADHVYALNTIYFLCATVGVFAIAHWANIYSPRRLKESALWRRPTAVARYLAYKCFQLPALIHNSSSLGVLLLGIIGTVFFFAMTLGPKPYYWPNTDTLSYGSSPPIATRAGWVALALLPFVLALGTKANLISMLTGVPHEKLQVFHHWTSYAMFVLALVHTFPFIIYHIDKGDMVEKWKTDLTYWTGVAALIPQAYLTLMSLPAIRNRYYEFFKATHFVVALLFILFFFFHCDFRLSSWDYFIAAGAIYILSLSISQIRTYLMHGRHKAILDLLPCGLVRVRIPTLVTWTPGQHVFIRFLTSQLGLHCLTAHPFTICSVSHDPEQSGKPCEMIFYVKPRGGLTARLAKIANQHPGASKTVLLEGPYGGVPKESSPEATRFDTVLVVSGGSGGGFSLGMVEAAMRAGLKNSTIRVVYATRSEALAEWYYSEIEDMIAKYQVSTDRVTTSINVTTDDAESSRATTPADTDEAKAPEDVAPVPLDNCGSEKTEIQKGQRPNLPAIIEAATTASGNKRVGIYVCGSASMLHDVRNAAAEAQRRVLSGSIEEVYLHTESFS